VEKSHRLEHLEAAFQPIDVSHERASLFNLVAEGRVVAPDIDVVSLGSTTVLSDLRRETTVRRHLGHCPVAELPPNRRHHENVYADNARIARAQTSSYLELKFVAVRPRSDRQFELPPEEAIDAGHQDIRRRNLDSRPVQG